MRLIHHGRFIVGLLALVAANAAVMTHETLSAWDRYVEQTKAALVDGARDPHRSLRVDNRSDRIEEVEFGQRLAIYSPHGSGKTVPSGLIHHWIGTIFIPNVRAIDVLNVLQDYESYPAFYKPAVVEAKLVGRKNNEFKYQLKFLQNGFGVKAGLQGQFLSKYTQLDRGTGYSITEATELVELQDAGTPNEHAAPMSEAHGYVERVFTIVRYRESGGGVYVELETLTLSRGVPASVKWLIGPLIQRFSREAMASTLEHLRDAIQAARPLEAASGTKRFSNSGAIEKLSRESCEPAGRLCSQ